MSISRVGSNSASFVRQNFTITNSSSSASTNSTTGPVRAQPPQGFRAGPPKELTREDLAQIKNKISESGGEGADKIDNLIQNFDQYDKGTGKISLDQFKSYAEQNGISLPRPKQQPAYQGPPTQGVSAEADAGGSAVKGSVSVSLRKYSSNAKPASASSGSTSSSSTDYSSMSTSDLEKLAAKGDTKAKAELEKREKREASSSTDQNTSAIPTSIDVEA